VAFSSTSSDASSWSWDFGDGGSANLEDPNHVYISNGSFLVTLIVSNGCGSDTITQTVNVNGVGIDDLDQETILIYPVPANDYVTIKVPEMVLNQNCIILDNSGRVVLSFKLLEPLNVLNVEPLSDGVYRIIVGETVLGKIVKITND
jgi:PKD repeat protein